MRYILKGQKPVRCPDFTEWERWYKSSFSDRQVARTRVGKVIISTVFLGFSAKFETKVFGGKFDQKVYRYSTWEKAERCHKLVELKIWRKK